MSGATGHVRVRGATSDFASQGFHLYVYDHVELSTRTMTTRRLAGSSGSLSR